MLGLKNEATAQMLVVDDEPLVRELLSLWLGDAGYSCATAGSTQEALAHVRSQPVDLVTLDISMPGGSGLDLLDQIKHMLPDAAVIMLTAETEIANAIRALTAGAYGYLIKPIARQALLLQVGNALEERRQTIAERRHTQDLEHKLRTQVDAVHAANHETIRRLAKATGYRDGDTGDHINRVGIYSELLAAAIGWESARAEQIRLAAPMHDAGKIGIPDEILCKPGKLTREEVSIMRSHVELGAALLAGSESPVLKMAHEIALCHHERWDGGGYPAGLREQEIPQAARIVAIVDVYDALTHDRVYRPALAEPKVLAILNSGRGTHFDPQLLDAFLSLIPEMREIAEAAQDIEKSGPEELLAARLVSAS